MPHSVSAKKSLRRSKERQLRNKGVKSRITTEARKFKLAIERGSFDEARKQLSFLTKLLQKAAAKRVINPGTAARRQARLQAHLNRAAAAGTAAAPTA